MAAILHFDFFEINHRDEHELNIGTFGDTFLLLNGLLLIFSSERVEMIFLEDPRRSEYITVKIPADDDPEGLFPARNSTIDAFARRMTMGVKGCRKCAPAYEQVLLAASWRRWCAGACVGWRRASKVKYRQKGQETAAMVLPAVHGSISVRKILGKCRAFTRSGR